MSSTDTFSFHTDAQVQVRLIKETGRFECYGTFLKREEYFTGAKVYYRIHIHSFVWSGYLNIYLGIKIHIGVF